MLLHIEMAKGLKMKVSRLENYGAAILALGKILLYQSQACICYVMLSNARQWNILLR